MDDLESIKFYTDNIGGMQILFINNDKQTFVGFTKTIRILNDVDIIYFVDYCCGELPLFTLAYPSALAHEEDNFVKIITYDPFFDDFYITKPNAKKLIDVITNWKSKLILPLTY